jgi:hypothetical protein
VALLPRYRHERGVPCIDVRVRTMRQLFDFHDPAPFRERDLDDDVADYLLGGLEDLPRAHTVKIAIFIAEREPGDLPPEEIVTALRDHFAWQRERIVHALRDHVRRAQFALAMGLAVLAAFLSLAELTTLLGPGRGREIVREGLVIIAWVAMWRPLEALLYDRWPHVQRRRLRDRILAAEIEVFYGRSGP